MLGDIVCALRKYSIELYSSYSELLISFAHFCGFSRLFFCREGEALTPLWRIPIVYRVELTGCNGGRDCREAFCRSREGCELRPIRA